MAAKHLRLISERIPYQAELAPRNHQVQIRPGYLLRRIEVALLGSVTATGGSVNGTSTGPNPGGLLQRVEVECVAIGKYVGGTIKSLTPRTMFNRRILDRGRACFDLSLGSTGIDGTAATFNVNTRFDINFENPKALKPIETALHAASYGQITVKLTNGGVVNIMRPGNNRTWDYSSLYYEITEVWEQQSVDAQGKPFMPLAVMVESDPDIYINQATKRFSVDGYLNKGEQYVDMLFQFESTNQTLVDTLDNQIDLYSQGEHFFGQYQAESKQTLEDYLSETNTGNTPRVGVRYFDIAEGMISGALPDVTALLDVNSVAVGADRIKLSTRRLIYPSA